VRDKRGLQVLVVVGAVVLASLAYGFLPFEAAGGLDCGAPLRGSSPKERVTTGFLVGREKPTCDDKGKSRLIITGIAAVILLAIGTSAVLLPESQMERAMFSEDELPDYGP
jgi:hypothetical protein